MNIYETLIKFINSVKNGSNSLILESISNACCILFEGRILPDVTFVGESDKLRHHFFKLKKNEANSKVYKVAVRDKNNKLIAMLVQFARLKPDQSGELGNNVWRINFVQDGQSDFNVTNQGSLDAFNSVFSVIKFFIETENPEYITYKATDADESKASQKGRIYNSYFNSLGLTRVDPSPIKYDLFKI